MFEILTGKLEQIFQQMRRRGKLSEQDVDLILREVRLSLLDADVHFTVVKEMIARIRERAVGSEISRALNPAQQIIKIVHEELIYTLGSSERLDLSGPKPRLILLVGLQGSGKTTFAGKLALLYRKQGERVMLVAADPYRPAAILQIQTLGEKIGVDVFSQNEVKPPQLIKNAQKSARLGGHSLVIVDTAGRSQLDFIMMEELKAIESSVKPVECLLVIDAMIGQEALHIAEGFRDSINLTGLVFTKIDGDARGGAAISIRNVVGVPIKFLSTGENLDTLELFDSSRLASRILGMGDVIGLIEKAESAFNQKEAISQSKKIVSGEFTLEDFLSQLMQLRKMGSLQNILDMLPGKKNASIDHSQLLNTENQLRVTESIIQSMTINERQQPDLLNASRRRRIARGCGRDVQDVNRVIKQFRDAQRIMKSINKDSGRGFSRLFG